ncbi:hypothetical protein GCM10023081_23000 [Arthrobacter ginkgonis]|uniref:Uncharacterized protein n=1 Tax=Arthrobacter ginkgonis TaxID=1630594 RepID=A0ABP7CDZ7_9MICC
MGHAQNPPTAPSPKSEAKMESQDRVAWPEDFGASTATSRMRDVARRRREAEEKLALHLLAAEPQLRSADPHGEVAMVSAVLQGPVTPVHVPELPIHESHAAGATVVPEQLTAPAERAKTPE